MQIIAFPVCASLLMPQLPKLYPTSAIQMGKATWAVWASVKKYWLIQIQDSFVFIDFSFLPSVWFYNTLQSICAHVMPVSLDGLNSETIFIADQIAQIALPMLFRWAIWALWAAI